MKKRRVLALLLALSLAVSMNGMTVLAAGTGETEVAGLSLEEAGGEAGESSEGDELKGNTDDSEKDSEEKKQEGSEEKSEDSTEEKTEEGTEEGSETDGETGGGSLEDDDTEEVPEEEVPDAEELLPGEETLTEETEEKVSEEEEKKNIEAQTEVRMVTFTDDTGMRVTYDANEAAAYKYTVAGGVLTAVTNEDDTPVSGNVVLSQPGSDDTYETFTSIAASVFAGNTKITYVKIPTGVTGISDGAFQGCTALKGIYIPTKVTSIGSNAFEGCSALAQLAIPKSVTSIGAGAFKGDSKLFMVHMKDADYSVLDTIGDSAFEGCSSLQKFCSDEEFNFPESITTIGARAFYGCARIPKVIMSDAVTSIGTEAFTNCSSVAEISLSSGLSTISENAFENCTGLQSVTFGNNNLKIFTEIAAYAFRNCSSLGSIELPDQINSVKADAFNGCNSLKRIYIKNGRAALEQNAFPNGNQDICLMGTKDSTTSEYATTAKIRFVAVDDSDTVEYYKYTAKLTGPGTDTAKPISIVVSSKQDGGSSDVNKLNSGKGVAAGTEVYVYIMYNGNSGIQMVPGSLKCNGTAITAKNKIYTFKMPIGSAVISAEFEYENSSVNIKGFEKNVSTELSNGNELKIGQTTKLFLTSDHPNDDGLIPTSKIKYSISPNSSKSVASVAADGTIKALAEGTTVICATVHDANGEEFTKRVTIVVSLADVSSIKIRATEYEKSITLSTDEDGVQSASIDSDRMTKAYSFKLKATAYDALEDDMAVAFKWTSSDSKVAKLSSTSTTSASSVNTVTIPANTSGEATISVTATNADKKTVTQKFIISVKNYTPRLGASTITINPNLTDGAVLEIISAYDGGIVKDSEAIYEEKIDQDYGDFTLKRDAVGSTDTVSKYTITARPGLADGTYNRRVKVRVENTDYKIPIKIVVKKSTPNPKVGFVKNQPKLNLFYKNDGTEFNMTVSGLGKEQVSSYALEALSTSDDDKLFTDNFQVAYVSGNSCRITQKSDEILYTSKKKPAVTGYLVLKFDGYKSSIVKKYKITIPTQTAAPSYALSRTSDTYYAGCDTQNVDLQLLDRKSKNRVVNVDDGHYSVNVKPEGTRAITTASLVNDNGQSIIRLPMSSQPEAGKVYLELTNDLWAAGKSFTYTYTIKTSSSVPKISLKSSTITMNPSYPEKTASFQLVSNQTDTVISTEQTFEPNINDKTKQSVKDEYEKLEVIYQGGIGEVALKDGYEDNPIKDGTYTFVCDGAEYEYRGTRKANKLTLKVRVSKGSPQVTLKGSTAFNTFASQKEEDGSYTYVEKSELLFVTKNLPTEYQIDKDATLNSIECTTKGYAGYEEQFDWDITDDKLKISMEKLCDNKTYSFSIVPTFINDETDNRVEAKKLSFNIKVYSGRIAVSLSGTGKLNLLDRTGERTTKNSIVYTPKFTNLKDQVEEAAVYDANGAMPVYDPEKVSELFEVNVSADGKLYVSPKTGVELENNKTYKIMIWMKLKDYQSFDDVNGNGTWSKTLSVKTAQTLPKIVTDKSEVNLYLSNKNYEATFVVDKKDAASVGKVTSIAFDEKDEKAKATFVNTDGAITAVPQEDGSLLVKLKLRNTVAYSCNTTNKIKMYIEFEGQGTNTPGTAITMNVKINK